MKNVVVGVHLRREDIEPVAKAIPSGDVWMSVVEIDDDHPLADRDLLIRVAKIRAELLERATFIAVRYGYTLSGAPAPSPAILERLQDRAGGGAGAPLSWRAILEANRDNVEMTLKVASSSPKPRPRREDFTSGAAYLRALHESAAVVDETFKEAAEKTIHPIEHRWIPRDNASLEMAALVPRSRVDEIRAAAEQLKRDFPRIPFLLSGPWPLEVFADADHE